MAPISPGTMSGPPRKPRKPTETTKAYRYEGFAKRLSKIKIDPVHTVQRARVDEAHDDLSQSHFRTALDEWSELNLSATFTSFLNKANSLSESLPQLLHHADKIFSLLHEHIKKKDVLALEPLLSLVAHLAHDLGSKFEGYFASTVKLVAQESASIEDPTAIECCFNCLAWMFKYMSRVLVQDLRPLLDIMMPYLSAKKDYVRRFSAESLAFLLRKAAVLSSKKPMPLNWALSSLFSKLEEESSPDILGYEKALMTLLSESAMGVDAHLHSSSTDLFKGAFEVVGRLGQDAARPLSALSGTIINLVHRTDAEGFRPLLLLIAEASGDIRVDGTLHDQMAIRLLLVAIATRKGSRISDWQHVFAALMLHLNAPVNDHSQYYSEALLAISACCLQYSPMDLLLPYLNGILDKMTTRPPSYFCAFCETVANNNRQRFQDLVSPRLQQYIVSNWSETDIEICYLLGQLRNLSASSLDSTQPGYIVCPKEWERSIIQKLTALPKSGGFPEDLSRYFRLSKGIHFLKDAESRISFGSVVRSSIKSVLNQERLHLDMPARLALGWAFNLYLSISDLAEDDMINSFTSQQPELYQLIPFLESTLILFNRARKLSPQKWFDSVQASLCNNLLSESLELREVSLQNLAALGRLQESSWLTETAELLLEIVQTRYSPSNARQLSMLVRRLPQQQAGCETASAIFKLVPYFALGMLRHYHDRVRKELCIALGSMAVESSAETLIVETLTRWLQEPGIWKQITTPTSDNAPRLSAFQCSNLEMVERVIGNVLDRHSRAGTCLQDTFREEHLLHPPKTPVESRLLALQAFLEMPEVAERRSRILSPVFLSIQQGKTNVHMPQSDESTSSHTMSPDFGEQSWTLRERKMFLELLGKVGNPRVLYRSREIYDGLSELLTNGNAEIRKLALAALLRWKDPSLVEYADILLRIAEEKNATTELAQMLGNSEDTGSVKPHHRPNVLPVLLRLVFGQLVGRSGTHGSQEAKRKSILRLLFQMEEQEVNAFLSIALGRLSDVSVADDGTFSEDVLNHDVLSQDQQYGFLRMIMSFQDILQSQFASYGGKIVDAVLYCLVRACHQTNESIGTGQPSESSLVKNIRRSALQCLTTIFEFCSDIDWNKYSPIIFEKVVGPRLPNFAIEVAQGVSGLLRMFSVWCKSTRLFPLLKRDERLTGNLWKILGVPSAREDVKTYVLDDVLTPLLDLSYGPHDTSRPIAELLKSEAESIFQALNMLLLHQPPKGLLLAVAKVIPHLAQLSTSSASANELLSLLIKLLCEPSQRIPPHIKGQLLSATESLLSLQEHEISIESKTRLYDIVSRLFNYFKDQPNRIILCKLLGTLARNESQLEAVVQICEDLNAVSNRRLGEIDYEKRLASFIAINAQPIAVAIAQQWSPLLNNLLFFSRTADDFAIRSNATACLKQFIIKACESSNLQLHGLVRDLLLPAFKQGAKENSELVRADFVVMFGLVVRYLPNAPDIEDMKVLLVGNDEEASFFTNILHIQQHRRLRALRRLLTETEEGVIATSSISGFFIPLLERFINAEGDDETSQGMKGQSIAAMSTMLQWTDWKSFRTITRQYRTDLENGVRPERDTIKLLGVAADALTSALAFQHANDTGAPTEPHLKASMPSVDIIAAELKSKFIPRLSKFIHHKDEAEISLRIPASKVAVKLIKLLPAEELPSLVGPIILDISQILRSRTQESRDVARNTLAEIVQLLGSSSIDFVLKEMRTALTRGYQLHVLSFTLHTILLKSTPSRQIGDLDYCLENLVSVIMDDVFGNVGQEKENQDYISGMREVKSSKSQDTMEILAKCASVRSMSRLVTPFQTLLAGNLSTKQSRQVDELFRRIGVGIAHNEGANSRDLLLFAYELIQAFYKTRTAPSVTVLTTDQKNRQRFLVQMKNANEGATSSTSSLLYKIPRFALDIVRSTVLKHTDLLKPENIHGFIPIIGDTLVEAQEDVKISALRLLSAVIRLPLQDLDNNAPLYVMEAVKIVRNSVSTSEEFPQAALKLVAAILRERTEVQVRDSDVAYLLQRTMSEMEEPDRQGVIFNFIKAVMARKYQLPEVYDLMDKVAIMMVTNQAQSARDVTRSVYVHFLVTYPQSTVRWNKQLKFMVKNLDYETREGRRSVMEAIHLLLQKLRDDLLHEAVSSFFIPIVLRIANDDDSNCREMGGLLLSQLYGKATGTQLNTLLEPLRGWLEQKENSSLVKLSLQAWSIYFDSTPHNAETEVPNVRKAVAQMIQIPGLDDEHWVLGREALELYTRLSRHYPALIMIPNQAKTWAAVRQLLLYRNIQIQTSATALVKLLLQSCAADTSNLEIPLNSAYGLRLDTSAVLNLLRNSVKVMKYNENSDDLGEMTLQNLVFLGTYVERRNLPYTIKVSQSSNEHDTSDEAGGSASDSEASSVIHSNDEPTMTIPAITYLLDQLASLLRREPGKLTSAAFRPRLSALSLLIDLLPQLSDASLQQTTLTGLLMPLTYITDPSLRAPRSADPTFPVTYQTYTDSAHELQEIVQKRVGDAEYVKLMTTVSKIVRERRGERRTKRAIERVANPERAEREKKRKRDIKKRRKQSVVDIHRKRRRADLGF